MARKNQRHAEPEPASLAAPREGQEARPHDSASAALPWLRQEKVTVPEQVAGYLHRPALMERILPTAGRATVLKAPGGFGKTTLLSECCRSLKKTGVLTAWLTLDIEDAPQVVAAYLAFAFQEAGLDVLSGLEEPASDHSAAGNRIEILVRAIARYGAPCVLALDELERLTDPDALDLVNLLLNSGPQNLALAIACREFPDAVDIGSSVLSGRAALFDADRLRFSPPEIESFVGTRLSRRELAALVRDSGGWPIALRIIHNERSGTAAQSAREVRDVAGNWVESRLWRGLTPDDRELLLDVGLFERIDGPLLDEVLGENGLMKRIEAMLALAGLLESVRVGGSQSWRLHPLIREYCARRRSRDTPERFQSLHRRIAEALARRGETVTAMRHAAEAGATDLTGSILEDVGALRLWLREGIGRLQSADRFLTPEITARYPRLALARCVVLMTTGRINEARQAYRAAAEDRRLAASRQAPAGALEFELDDCTVRGMLCLYGCEPFDSEFTTAMLDDYARFAAMSGIDTAMRTSLELGLCIAHNLKAEFDAALTHAARAERYLGGSSYIRMFVDLYRGQVAMAQGRVSAAADCYLRAYRIARTGFLRDPGQAVFAEVLIRELDLERHRLARLERAPLAIPRTLFGSGTPLASFAAASGTAAELTLRRKGADAAIVAIDEIREYALEAGLPALVRYLAGLRVQLMAAEGRVGDAEQAWRLDGLPEHDEGCLDLEGQSWREMESLACARLRLCVAAERFEEGERLGAAIVAVAAARGLRRTSMRGLALSVALERAAQRPVQAQAHLVAYLRLLEETDYAAPAVRERAACLPALEELLEGPPDPQVQASAKRLLAVLRGVGGKAPEAVRFSPRELQVLEHLGVMADKDIAKALDLSVPGVRYHVARIFAKLGVNDRVSAVDYAHRAGLLADG